MQIDPLAEHRFISPDPVGFGGQWGFYTDNETAMVTGNASPVRPPFTLNGMRYYDPSIGRFLTRDQVG